MADIKKLSIKELKELSKDAKEELIARVKRDKEIVKTRTQVERRLAKSGLTIADLYPLLGAGRKAPKAGQKKKKRVKKRPPVKPKYKDRSGKNKWSGRGRSPAWVTKICENKGIDVAKFKTLATYQIQR